MVLVVAGAACGHFESGDLQVHHPRSPRQTNWSYQEKGKPVRPAISHPPFFPANGLGSKHGIGSHPTAKKDAG